MFLIAPCGKDARIKVGSTASPWASFTHHKRKETFPLTKEIKRSRRLVCPSPMLKKVIAPRAARLNVDPNPQWDRNKTAQTTIQFTWEVHIRSKHASVRDKTGKNVDWNQADVLVSVFMQHFQKMACLMGLKQGFSEKAFAPLMSTVMSHSSTPA